VDIWYNSKKSSELAIAAAQRLMQEAEDKITDRIRLLYDPMYAIVGIASMVPDLTAPPIKDDPSRMALMLRALHTYPQILSLYVGFDDGDFFMVTHLAGDKADTLRKELQAPPEAVFAVEIVTIRTTGDRVQDRRLAEIGGKGLFTKEIEEALFAGRVDLAVHSLKDVETWLPDGLEIACVLARDDPRDAFLSMQAPSLAALPKDAKIGTASLRRQAQLLLRRPDLTVVPIRGNVDTRLRKLDGGEVDAIVLALCGLERLGLAEHATEVLSRDVMLPAVGQGALAIECRKGEDGLWRRWHLAALEHQRGLSWDAVAARYEALIP